MAAYTFNTVNYSSEGCNCGADCKCGSAATCTCDKK